MRIEEVSEHFQDLDPDRPADFDTMAEAVFRYQVRHNAVYRRFAGETVRWTDWRSAPALPIEAFKLAPVAAFPHEAAVRVFESSGTTGRTPSRHFVRDLGLYDRSLQVHFVSVFGRRQRLIVGHLPGYTRRGERSSLVYMVEQLIDSFGSNGSGFFLNDVTLFRRAIERASAHGMQVVLFGAAFGLLDLLETWPLSLPVGATVIETGGMKTHRRSIARDELHTRLAEGFGIPRASVFSEYGMTELLSQCYTRGDSVFLPPSWMKFRVVDVEDPVRELADGEAGALHVFDLANVYTVSSILTQDLAVRRNGGFEVLGRLTGAELRGCNFLMESNG